MYVKKSLEMHSKEVSEHHYVYLELTKSSCHIVSEKSIFSDKGPINLEISVSKTELVCFYNRRSLQIQITYCEKVMIPSSAHKAGNVDQVIIQTYSFMTQEI